LLLADHRELVTILKTEKSITGINTTLARPTSVRAGKFKKRKAAFNPRTIKYLQTAWGVGVNYVKQLTAAARSPSASAQPPPSTSGNMIVDFEVAERSLTPKALYVMNQMRMTRVTDFTSLNRKESASGKVAAGIK